jgi:hypothetical protein
MLFPLLVRGEGEGEVTRSRYSSGDFKAQGRWPAWSKWCLKRHAPPLPNPFLGQESVDFRGKKVIRDSSADFLYVILSNAKDLREAIFC